MKISELKELPSEELRAKEGNLKKELFNFRIQHLTGHLENPMKLRLLRRDVARVRTIIKEKETAVGLSK